MRCIQGVVTQMSHVGTVTNSRVFRVVAGTDQKTCRDEGKTWRRRPSVKILFFSEIIKELGGHGKLLLKCDSVGRIREDLDQPKTNTGYTVATKVIRMNSREATTRFAHLGDDENLVHILGDRPAGLGKMLRESVGLQRGLAFL